MLFGIHMNLSIRGFRLVPLLLLVPLFALSSGCHSGKYVGYEPTSRSFYEDPDMSQCYIGVDLSFTLDNPLPHWQHAASKVTPTGP
jgi:hypothetical protein